MTPGLAARAPTEYMTMDSLAPVHDRTAKRMLGSLALAVALVLVGSSVHAQERSEGPGNTVSEATEPGVPWSELSVQQQRVLEPYRQRWSSMPPGRQQAMARGAERWDTLTPEQRAKAQDRFRQWQELPPGDRERARERYEKFRDLPPEEQERLRKAYQKYQDLPPEQREQLRERWRDLPPEQRESLKAKWRELSPEERARMKQLRDERKDRKAGEGSGTPDDGGNRTKENRKNRKD
jgi:hypothetical protein